jgi:pimeloyl-ACP methyl ester carboxylesterase
MRIVPLLTLTLLTLGLCACAETIARRVVAAPNAARASHLPWQTTIPSTLGVSLAEHVRVERLVVASGALSLRAVIMEPSTAPWQLTWVRNRAEMPKLPRWQHAWSGASALPPLGTVVILHGLNSSSEATVEHGLALVNAGFRCLLIDIRGHGESTGTTLSFGKSEAQDLREALDRLQQSHTITPPLIVLGYSFGGAIALIAAHEPTPITIVIAVAPFARFAEVAPNFAHSFGGWLSWLLTDGMVRETIAAIARAGNFDPQKDSPLAWAPRVHVPVLLVHGADDDLVPPAQSAQLAKAIGGPVTLQILPGHEHIRTVLDANITMPTILPWLESWTGGAYRSVDGPLLGWPGTPASASAPFAATWAFRAHPADTAQDWPRPVGGRNLRTWTRLPVAWLGRDLTLDLGSIDGADETWCGAARIGGHPAPGGSFPPFFRRYVISGWMTTPELELSVHLTTTTKNGGLILPAGGLPLLRLRDDARLPQGKN